MSERPKVKKKWGTGRRGFIRLSSTESSPLHKYAPRLRLNDRESIEHNSLPCYCGAPSRRVDKSPSMSNVMSAHCKHKKVERMDRRSHIADERTQCSTVHSTLWHSSGTLVSCPSVFDSPILQAIQGGAAVAGSGGGRKAGSGAGGR